MAIVSDAPPIIAPTYYSEEQKAKWLALTEKYGTPVYKYPFWFWDAEEPFGPAGNRNFCNPFAFPSDTDIAACAVWNNKTEKELPTFSVSPGYMEDYNAITGGRDMVVLDSPVTPESAPVHKEAAEVARQASIRTFWWYVVGFSVASGVAYSVYRRKRGR